MAKHQCKNTAVRGPDGALYILSKTAPPVKMTEDEAQKLTKILEDAKPKLEAILKEEIAANIAASCGQNIHITIPDVLME
jgi:hypothetical protein